MSGQSERRGPWGPIATLALTALIAVAFAVAQLSLAIPYLLYRRGAGSLRELERAAAGLETDGLFIALSVIGSGAVALALTLAAVWIRRGPGPAEYLGFERAPGATLLRWLLYTVLCGAGLELVTHLAGYPSIPDWMIQVYESAASLPLLLVAVVAAAPVVEETVFRGFFLEGVRRSRLGPPGAVLLAALAWALTHVQYEAYYVGQVFCLGLLLGAARVRTGSLWVPIAMHALFNAASSVQLLLEVG